MHGVSLIVLNAVARSLLSEVVVLSSLPSKVRAQAARASSVCGDAMALVRGANSKLLVCCLAAAPPERRTAFRLGDRCVWSFGVSCASYVMP